MLCMQIATKYLMPELVGTQLSPKLYKSVSEAFVAKFGEYAGWAQNVLFIGELPSHKAAVESCAGENKSANAGKRGRKRAVACLEQGVSRSNHHQVGV